MTDHPRYQSMLRATSAQAPLHDDLPPFVEAPLRADGVRYPIDGSLIVTPHSTLLLTDPEHAAPFDADEPNLCWSYERATD